MIFLFMINISLYSNLFASSEEKETKSKSSQQILEYKIENKEQDNSKLNFFIPKIEQLFENPAFLSGLETSSAAINRSVESLMQSLFYNLLDQDFIYRLQEHSTFKASTNRLVFLTTMGSYIVVDRLDVGPEYLRQVAKKNKISVSAASNIAVNLLNISLKTDALRIAQSLKRNKIRSLIDDWFYVLPILERILPPAFNALELYDPISLINEPIQFPLTVKNFFSMPVTNIKSYGVLGGLHFPFTPELFENTSLKEVFRDNQIIKQLPYTIFIEGDYRINVLRKSENIAWVGITRSQRVGHSFAGLLGRTFFYYRIASGKYHGKVYL